MSTPSAPPPGPYGPPPGDPYAPPTGPVQPYGQGQGHGQGYAQPYGPGHAPGHEPERPTDVVSVLGLVMAFLVAPVGLVLSIIGVARTRDGQRKGRGLAIAGIVVSVVVSLVVAGLVVLATLAGAWFTENADEIEEQLGQLPSVEVEIDPDTVLPPGETAQVGAFDIAVTGVDLDATDELVAAGNAPPEGRYVVFDADVTNTSDEARSVYQDLVGAYVSAGGTTYDEFTCDATFPGEVSGLDELAPGGTTSARWCVVVPEAEVGGGVVTLSATFDLTGAGSAVWAEE